MRIPRSWEIKTFDGDGEGGNILFPALPNGQMGSWFSDATGINIDVNQAATNLWNDVNQVLSNIHNAIGGINWNQLANNIGQAVRTVANIYLQVTPIYYVTQALKTNPLTAHAFAEFDKLVGGGVTDIVNIETLTLRVARGDPIDKSELIHDGLFALKVVVAVLTFGVGAAAAVSISAGELSQGSLAKTSLGKDAIVIGTAAAGADANDGDVAAAIATTTTEIGVQAGAQAIVKNNTPPPSIPLGGIAQASPPRTAPPNPPTFQSVAQAVIPQTPTGWVFLLGSLAFVAWEV